MRRHTFAHHTELSAGPPSIASSHSASDDSVVLDAAAETFVRARERAHRPFIPSGLTSSPAQSADHPSSTLSLPKTDYTMMAESANTACYAKSGIGKESLSELTGRPARVSINSTSREDAVANASSESLRQRRSSFSPPPPQTVHQPLQSPHSPKRRPRPLPYPSPTAAMSGQLIREAAAAAVVGGSGADALPATPSAEAAVAQAGGVRDATEHRTTAGDTIHVTGDGASWRREEDATGPHAPPRPFHRLATPTTATGPPSYVSVRTAAPSASTVRLDGRPTSQDGASGDYTPPPPAPLGSYDAGGGGPPTSLTFTNNASTSAGVRVSDDGVMNATHSGTSFSAFQPSATRARESTNSVDKSVESTVQRSTAATTFSPSRVMMSTAGTTAVTLLASHGGRSYRASSRRFSTSVGRNVDSHVYLNTNVMSHYEMVPNTTTTAPPPPAQQGATAAAAEGGGQSSRPTPLSSSMASVAAAGRGGEGGGGGVVGVPGSRPPTAIINAVAGSDALGGDRDAPASFQQQQQQGTAARNAGGAVAAVAAVDLPISARYSTGIAAGAAQWDQQAVPNSHVVRVVSGLLRSPYPDELGATQLSESSLQSPPSTMDFNSVSPRPADGTEVSGGVGAAGGSGAAAHAGAASVGIGRGPGGVSSLRSSNPISALLTGARTRPTTAVTGAALGGTGAQQQQHGGLAGTASGAQSTTYGCNVSHDGGAGVATNTNAAAAVTAGWGGGNRGSRRPSPHGFWRGGREGMTAYKNTQHPFHRSRSTTDSVTSTGETMNSVGSGADANTPVPSPPTGARMPRLTSLNASSPASWASSSSPSHQQQQQHSQSAPVKHSSFVTSAASTHDGQLSSSAENSIGRHPPLGPAFSSSYTLRPEGGGTNGSGNEAAAAPVAAAPRPPCQRVLSSLKDVFTAAASFRSIPNLHNVSVGAATSSPSSPLLHQRGQSGGMTAAAAAASTAAMRNRLAAAAAAAAVPPPPPLPPTFALFGALERLSRFSELVQLHQEHTAVIDEFLSRLTMELHQTRHMGTCSASSLGGGALAGSEETQVDHEFLQWHRTLMYLFHNPSEMMKVGVEFFSDALNSWPLHMLYLTCCFHVTAAEHGFAALTTALRTGGIVCSGKGLFAALAVAMAEDGEMGLIRSTACMYRAAFYTGALMRKRHQLFDLESRVTTSSGFTLLVVNIPILTLRRLVARVNEGYDVFACIKGADRGSGGGDGAFSGRSCYSGGGAGPTGASPTSPVASSNPFQPHAVIEVSRVISSRSAVLCGHPLDLLRLDVVLARFADFNGVKIHKEYLPAGGPENSNFYNKRMPHDLLGFWQARGVSFSLASLRLPVYSPVNGDLWSDTPAATAASAMASDRTAFDALNAALSSLAAPPPGQSYRDGLFMYMVAEAATSANQDLTYSLRHMRDGNVLLDFSTHAIGIGRLIAWTNKSITVLAAPENRHESSAMPPPRRSPKDEAVLNTLGKLAVINEVLRAVSENLEQPPDALANPHVDLFTTFTELGLLEVMRVAGEGGEGDGTAVGGAANTTANGGPFDGSTMNQNSNARVTNSAPGSSRTLLAPARSFSDHLTGGAARGSGVSASGLVPASASVSRGDAPGSPFYTTPVPAAGRRMKSNVSALISAKSFANHPGLGGAASTTNNNTSVSAATYNATGTGNASNLSLSAPTAASPPAAAGLSIPSFDAGSGAAALNVSFAPTPPAAPLSTPPVAAVVSVNNAVNVNTAADFDLVGVPPPPPPSSSSLRSQPGAAGPPTQPPATTTATGTPAAAAASPGASGTQQENLLVSVAQGALSIGSYPECRWSAALTAFAVEGGSLPGPITTTTTPFGHHPVPSPTSVLIHRDQRRSGAASSSTGPLAPNGPAPSASTATTMTTNTGITSVNNTAVRLPSSHPDLTDKTSSHESDADYRAASLLRPPSSAHHPSSRLSNSPSPHIARFASDGDMSPPNHARSHTNGAHGGSELGRVATTMSAASEDAETGIASAALVAVAQGGAPSAAVEVVGSPPSSSTPLQLGVQLDSRGNTPTSPQTLWHTVSPVSRADSPAQPSPPGTATTAMIAGGGAGGGGGGAAANAQPFAAVADSAELMLGRLNARSQQQQQRVSPAASTAVSDHYPVSYHSMRNSSNNNTQTTLRSLRGIQYVVGAEEPDASVSGTSGSGGGCAVTSPLLPQQQQRGVGGGGANGCGGGGGVSGLGHTELSPLSLNEKDFVVRRNNEYAGIINVYQVSPLITYYEMQFNCVLCDGAVLFAALLQKASGIAFPPYTLLLCPSVFSLLELWDGFEYEELWKRSIGVVSASRIASPMSAGLL